MHIPKCFGGGFRHHDFVCEKNIAKCYKIYEMKKSESEKQETLEKDGWF